MYRRSIVLGALFCGTLLIPTAARSQSVGQASPQAQLWDASISGDTVALKQALARGASIDSLDTRTSENGRRALNWAAYYDRVDALRILLARGAALEARNRTWNTALHHAAEAGALGTLRVLLITGADPTAVNLNGSTPLDVARSNRHPEAADLLQRAMRREPIPAQ